MVSQLNKKHISTRKRRENYKRYSFMVSLLIAVVALIECLVLLSFTTYSWIESSSSLIISTGKDGLQEMHVADNLNYQVLVSLDAAGNVNLTDDSKYNQVAHDGGYFRSVRYFNYAKTSSPDGRTFYFKKTNGDNTNPYRAGDTADYNTSYTYFDFELKNTTRSTKSFYFRSAEIFTINGHSSYSSMTADEQKIANAMRISIQKDNGTPDIYSIYGGASRPVNSTTGTTATQFTTRNITTGHYVYTGDSSVDQPLFSSEVNNNEESVENNISVRVWFDETDSQYRALSGAAKTTFDSAMASAEITLNFSLINDNVDYDQIYFDDFAYSHRQDTLGKFVTEEPGGSMFFHAYNAKQAAYVNYPMSKVTNSDNEAARWMASIPIPHTVKDTDNNTNYLTSNTTYYNNAYFFFGTASGTGDPTTCRYKWNLNSCGYMSIATPTQAGRTGNQNEYVITDATRYFRNLGVVRSSDQTSDNIVGFMQFSADNSGAMNPVYLRDRATGLTGAGYNMQTSSADNYQYITDSISYLTVQSQSSTGFDYSEVPDASRIYYFDIPIDSNCNFFTGERISSGKTQTNDVRDISDGDIYYVASPKNNDNQDASKYTAITLPALNDASGQLKRVYFYKTSALETTADWTNVSAHIWGHQSSVSNTEPAGTVITDATAPVEVTEDTLRTDNIYLNTAATGANAAATKTVAMLYDTETHLFKAFVPASWLTGGFYAHYNNLNFAYDNAASDKLRFVTGAASSYNGTDNIYTMLGYTNASTVASLSAGAGIGTWSDVREMSFATELIDSNIASAYVYKVGYGSGAYPMHPTDNLYLTFSAYVPYDGTALSNIAFTRYAAYNFSTVTGTWEPDETIGDSETTYYAVDPDGDTSETYQGWFHVAVLVDGTFENLIYDTITNDGGTLQYSYDNSSYSNIPVRIDTRRWVVPMRSGDNIYSGVYFKWTPYSGTVFDYSHSLSDGIYCIVTE